VSIIKYFTDLDAWKKGHDLLLNVYKITRRFPKEEVYGLTSQIRRAAVSITSNIAEGFSRYHFKEKINFYYNARGSASEVQNLLVVARDVGFLKNAEQESLNTATEDVKRLINGLVRSVDSRIS
jgi:four helix bundle protein